MKQVLRKGNRILVAEVPAPVVREGYALVKTAYSLISTGSELQALKSVKEVALKSMGNVELLKRIARKAGAEGLKATYSQIKRRFSEEQLGYSSSGVVIEKGNLIKGINVGEKVACAGTGFANHAEMNCIPKNLLVRIPKRVSFEEASFVGLGAIALQGIRRGRCELGENIAVIGLGLVGQITSQIAKALGCHVIGIDIDNQRVRLANCLGLEKGIAAKKGGSCVNQVLNLTKNEGADAVIICASSQEPKLVEEAIQMCRKRGRIVVVGNVNINVPWGLAYSKEIEVIMSCSYGPGRYDMDYEARGAEYPLEIIRWTETRNMEEFLNLIAEKKVNVKDLIGQVFPLQSADKAYDALQGGLISALIKYPFEEEGRLTGFTRGIFIKGIKAGKSGKTIGGMVEKGRINIGLIGAGGIAKVQHLPNIKKIRGYNLLAIADIDGINAKKTAQEFGASYCTTDYMDMLKDERIDAVLIATRHGSHAEIAINALKAGKHVLLEKPLALNLGELKKIVNAVHTSKGRRVFSVGFNRRYSDIARQARDYLKEKKGPCIILYRVNALAVPKGHWFNDMKEGGGRIIGEGCHFFDFFNWFIGANPKSVFAKSTTSDFANIFDENNVIATVKYEDGSIGMLCYNEIGSSSMPKERIEIFKSGSSLVIDDFREIFLDGKGSRYKKQDKGHYNELVEFMRAIRGEGNELLGFEESYNATLCSLHAVESMRKGKEIDL